MSLFPFIPTEISVTAESETLPLYTEVAWDFEKDKPIVENNTLKLVTENEAVKVWVYKTILTNRFEFFIYSWDYGCEVYSLLGKKFNRSLTEVEFKRQIKECLLVNPYISDVEVVTVTFDGGLFNATIKLKTLYGETEVAI